MSKLKFKKNEKGFTLQEVLISVAILSFVGVAFMSALGANFKLLRMADQRTTAESLARTQLEIINNAPYNFTSPYRYDNFTVTGVPAGYTVSHTVVLINPETGDNSTTDLGVQKVTVIVTSQQHTPPQVIAVEAYKR